MTLCLAWRIGEEVYFASDSRLTRPDSSILTDDATKIFKIGVEIYGPVPSDVPNGVEPLWLGTTFGLCFTGSYLNGSILADTMEEVLTNIQATPYSDISFDNLSTIAFTVYRQVSTQLMERNGSGALAEVLLGGYCPDTGEFQMSKFYPKPIVPGEIVEFGKETITLTDETIFIGDPIAKTRANELLTKINANYSHFHLLREIIQDSAMVTVGGNIQSGVFKAGKFKTYGIVEYSTSENEYGILEVYDHYKFRGLTLNLDDNELRIGGLHINKTFFNPFEEERNELFRQVIVSIDKSMDKLFENKDENK